LSDLSFFRSSSFIAPLLAKAAVSGRTPPPEYTEI